MKHKLHPNVSNLVNLGRIDLSIAVEMAKLPPEEQLKFVDEAIFVTNFKLKIQQRVKELKKVR